MADPGAEVVLGVGEVAAGAVPLRDSGEVDARQAGERADQGAGLGVGEVGGDDTEAGAMKARC